MTAHGTPYFLAWTTTPWTLPSNTALCVGPEIEYNIVRTFNPYSGNPETVVLAVALMGHFSIPKDQKFRWMNIRKGIKSSLTKWLRP